MGYDPWDLVLLQQSAAILNKVGLVLYYKMPPDYAGSINFLDRAVAIQLKLVGLKSDNVIKSNLATSYLRRANSLARQHEFSAASIDYKRAIEIHVDLSSDPDNAIWRKNLAQDHMYFGQALEEAGDLKGARFEHDLEFLVRLNTLAKTPENTKNKQDFVRALTKSLFLASLLRSKQVDGKTSPEIGPPPTTAPHP